MTKDEEKSIGFEEMEQKHGIEEIRVDLRKASTSFRVCMRPSTMRYPGQQPGSETRQ